MIKQLTEEVPSSYSCGGIRAHHGTGGMAVVRSGGWSRKLRAQIFSSKGEAEREPEVVHGLNPQGLHTSNDVIKKTLHRNAQACLSVDSGCRQVDNNMNHCTITPSSAMEETAVGSP